MTRIALPFAVPRKAVLRASFTAALVGTLALGTPIQPAAAAEDRTEVEYRYPFDPSVTTPEGGEFASNIANGKPRTSPHRGHDFSFAQARGVAIPAIADGIVRAMSSEGPLGNRVVLEHPDGAFSAYAHLDAPTPLGLGQQVQLGETIGYLGSTPKVPVHLHLTMGWTAAAMQGVGTFDPIPYIGKRLHPVTPTPKKSADATKPKVVVRAPVLVHSGALAV
jgi:murein DD-endopeptidase MepM/ murein hydrolase activator NlpD